MKLKTSIAALVVIALCALSGQAQTKQTPTKQEPTQQMQGNTRKSFEEFRKGILDNYSSFRNNILKNYYKFLDGIWDEFPVEEAKSRHAEPKPLEAPVADSISAPAPDSKPLVQNVVVPEDLSNEKSVSILDADPEEPEVDIEAEALKEQEPEQEVYSQTEAVQSESTNTYASLPKTEFDFFGMPMSVPYVEFDIRNYIGSARDCSQHWQELDRAKVAERVLPYLKALASGMGLNDYLTYRLIKSYVSERFKGYDANSRLSLIHYLMANAEYNVRLAMDNNNNVLLLLHCKQDLFQRSATCVDGVRYYVFADDDEYMAPKGTGILTCRMPHEINNCKSVDLRIGNLNLPYSPHHYDVEFGDIKISGNVNKNLFPILYRYPQLHTSDYALSTPDRTLRRSVANQVRLAVEGKGKHEAIDDILHFVQKGFEYATDQEYHGFEKPYFFEEMLFYDKCDCEDRAIFYTYLIWNVLGVRCHLINYPNHESAAVNIEEEIAGTGYEYDNTRFYISDPTYIGSSTGGCMDEFLNTPPKIDFEYK